MFRFLTAIACRSTLAVGLGCLIAGPAAASFTIDLIWADTGTATLTVSPGDETAPVGGNICADGALSQAGAGRCLRVELTASAPFTSALIALGWTTSPFGPRVEFAPARSFGAGGKNGTNLVPGKIGPIAASTCAGVSCDTAYGLFGGTAPSIVPAGQPASTPAGHYVIGSINFDLSNTYIESGDILAFLTAGTVLLDRDGVPAPVQINGAFGAPLANAPPIPEPSTAALLAFGTLGLAFAGRRRP